MIFLKFLEIVLIIYFFYYLIIILFEKAKKKHAATNSQSIIYAVEAEENIVTDVINQEPVSTTEFKEIHNKSHTSNENLDTIIEDDYDLSLEIIDSDLLGFDVTAENLYENIKKSAFDVTNYSIAS